MSCFFSFRTTLYFVPDSIINCNFNVLIVFFALIFRTLQESLLPLMCIQNIIIFITNVQGLIFSVKQIISNLIIFTFKKFLLVDFNILFTYNILFLTTISYFLNILIFLWINIRDGII